MITGVQKLKFMCMTCSMEHNRYIQEDVQQEAAERPHREQLAFLRKLNQEADAHMKQWVSEKSS
jgi:hypothetical protein